MRTGWFCRDARAKAPRGKKFRLNAQLPLDIPLWACYNNCRKTKKEGSASLTSRQSEEVYTVKQQPEGMLFSWCADTFLRYPFFYSFYVRTGGAFAISNTAHQINEEIRDKEVRLISAKGEQLGIMSAADALDKAADAELDLVKISPNAVPPVCKLMDYGKYRFEQTKRDKEAKKNQRVVEVKEVRMSPGIDSNDFNVKVRNAQRFLADGNRVKVAVRFRGREMAHTEIGKRLLEKFAEDCAEVAAMDKEPKLDGRHMTMFLSCKQAKDTKSKDGKNKDSKNKEKNKEKNKDSKK